MGHALGGSNSLRWTQRTCGHLGAILIHRHSLRGSRQDSHRPMAFSRSFLLPDVILIDADLLCLDSVQATHYSLGPFPRAHHLGLTMLDDANMMERVRAGCACILAQEQQPRPVDRAPFE